MSLIGRASPLRSGIAEVEREHRALLELVSALGRCQTSSCANRVARRLMALFRRHCRTEETLQELHAYPGLASHRDEHRLLDADLASMIKTAFADGACEGPESIASVARLLHHWLSTHMTGHDGPFLAHFNARPAA